ncbi:OmpA family protein [Flavobacterium psychrophilum]|uniref:OmpA family protein n=1 Tax=Flavobacterium psychrophilum TaxID=96345 RepID=UPI00090AC744|nr:OmpA family protein [Flavobacterium psychrophilum]EKT2072612.1 OmpA family protein [Flavobacterium psychrophilum]EKT4492125.1 OmpA family protein [Flavobacterium psychrophilum]SHH93151.1 Outer membrane protein precursor; OmpA family [Flavobacterium psychrophilum]
MRKLLFLCICIGFTYTSRAQTEDRKWNIGVHGGITQYYGDLGRDWYETSNTMYGFGGLSVSRYLGKLFDANLLLSKGTIGYNNGTTTGFKSDFNAASLNLRFNIVAPEYFIRPYIFTGVGAILFDSQLHLHQSGYDYILPSAGAGINFRLTPEIMLNLQETFLFSNKDRRDGVDNGTTDFKDKDSYITHMVGLTFNMGKSKDEDQDGVSDKNDNCSNTPIGVTVDKKGCPLDKDADGVTDYLDNCPDLAGSKSLNGCPDKDNDGVEDSKDRCPDKAGTIALKGCPDADKDGVADIDDKCVNTKQGTRVDTKGCPIDSDNDGVMDDMDRCPNIAGVMGLKGCPDIDGDGVADIDDKCPNVIGTTENKGCPEITRADIVRITYIGSKIFFENNSDKLKVASLSQLDELSKILNKYEGANLTIEGHTDSVGADDFNMTLSQKRSESVRQYLIGKGISDARLISVGYGETQPVVTNNTSLGKAKNRRVELKTNY